MLYILKLLNQKKVNNMEPKDLILFYFSIGFFIIGTFFFLLGYRNVDMAYNIALLKLQGVIDKNVELYDKTLWINNAIGEMDLYELGLRQLTISFILFFASFLFLVLIVLKELYFKIIYSKK